YYVCVVFFFFFQAEDGIRDFHVTGVQTCALPIYLHVLTVDLAAGHLEGAGDLRVGRVQVRRWRQLLRHRSRGRQLVRGPQLQHRSEERRVGKEWRSRWAPYTSTTQQSRRRKCLSS